MNLNLPHLFSSYSQLSNTLLLLIQTYLSLGHLSGLDFSDEVRFGRGKVADLLNTFSESIWSISLLERGTEGWLLAVEQIKHRDVGELDKRPTNTYFIYSLIFEILYKKWELLTVLTIGITRRV